MTHDLVVKIKSLTSLVPVPHLTYVCHQAHEFEEILQRHIATSVGAILALSEVSPHDQQHGDHSKDTSDTRRIWCALYARSTQLGAILTRVDSASGY